MRCRFFQLIAILAAVQMLGGHWLALQSVAWVGMMAQHAHEEALTVAIKKIFDGQHPCDLCKAVAGGRSAEEKQQVAKFIPKLEAVLLTVSPLPRRRVVQWSYGAAATPVLDARTLAPPTPPPQAV